MLFQDAVLAWLHFLFAFCMVGAMFTQAVLLRLPVDGRIARVTRGVETIRSLSAILVLVAGFSRAVWGAKGWAFYQAEPFFWAKIATFVSAGVMSVTAMIMMTGWVNAARADAAFVAPDAEVKRVRVLVTGALILFIPVLVFASLMARGIGMG